MFVPDASLPSIRVESREHFVLYSNRDGISVLPLTGFGGCWLSEVLGRDAEVTIPHEAALNLMLEFYVSEKSPTLD